MWPLLVIVSAPSLQLFRRIRKAQEPVSVQTFRPQPGIERFDEGVVGGLARPREVERDAALVSPKVQVARDELGALINAYRLRIAGSRTDPFQRGDDVLAAIADLASSAGA